MDDNESIEYSREIDNNCTSMLLREMYSILKRMKEKHNNPGELDEFYKIYERYLKTKQDKIIWDNINTPKDRLAQYKDIKSHSKDPQELLKKLAVLKLNGGLGTTMGCVGPKSAITVREGRNFIDLVAKQLKFLKRGYGVEVPLVLMNSFNTEKMTFKLINRHENIMTFNQSKYPRISNDTLLPLTDEESISSYYPPGHGDIFYSLKHSGMLDRLIADGREYLFISNIDNLAATVDLKLLEYFDVQKLEFMMEVTDKTRADIKGGTLIDYEGTLRLLEIAQVPSSKKSEFTSVRKFKIFNTILSG